MVGTASLLGLLDSASPSVQLLQGREGKKSAAVLECLHASILSVSIPVKMYAQFWKANVEAKGVCGL